MLRAAVAPRLGRVLHTFEGSFEKIQLHSLLADLAIRSAMCRRNATSSPASGLGATAGAGIAGGRPCGQSSPAAPCLRYWSRQRYSTLRLIANSSCNFDTLSPPHTRCATCTRNSVVNALFSLLYRNSLPQSQIPVLLLGRPISLNRLAYERLFCQVLSES